jgi:hypothetical protein
MVTNTPTKTKRQPPSGCKSQARQCVAPSIAPSLADLADREAALVAAAGSYRRSTTFRPAPKSASKLITDTVLDFCKNNPKHPLVDEFCDSAPFIKWKNVGRWLKTGGDVTSLLETDRSSQAAVSEYELHDRERDAEVPGFRG